MRSFPCVRRPEPGASRPMATLVQSHHDVLHATDTALRLVNQALGDLGTSENLARSAAPMAKKGAEGSGSLLSLASTLLRAYAEVASSLDRAIGMVTELEHEAEESQDLVRRARYTALREELDGVTTHVQFQVITSQQLGYAAAVTSDTERRREPLNSRFEPFAAEVPAVSNGVTSSVPKHVEANLTIVNAIASAL